MKVVELCGLSRSAGGLFYAISSLSKAMVRGGADLAVYGRSDEFVARDQAAWGPVPTASFKVFGPLQVSVKLRGMLRQRQPDLIHQHGIWLDSQWAALQWHRKVGGPVVVSPHGMLDPWALRNSLWKKKLAGWFFANESLRKASCIHALCKSEAEAIRAYGLDNPIAMIPNGVELPTLSSDYSPPPSEQRKLLFLGRIHPKKGLSELLEGWALSQILRPKSVFDWELLIAGWDDGGHEKGLKAKAEALGIGGSVSFLGPQYGDEKDALLRSVDAFILPSFSEGLPMSVLEAWSYGLPVLMTEFCNLPEGFDAGAALRIDPDPGSIANGLAELVAMSVSDLAGMGIKGRKLVELRFTWDKIAQDMQTVYEWCLGGDKPACIQES